MTLGSRQATQSGYAAAVAHRDAAVRSAQSDRPRSDASYTNAYG